MFYWDVLFTWADMSKLMVTFSGGKDPISRISCESNPIPVVAPFEKNLIATENELNYSGYRIKLYLSRDR